MSYEKTQWVNDSQPAINADNLNKIEQGIYDAHEGLEELDEAKVDKEAGKGLFSGNYNDLTNKPTIPTKTSDLTNDSGFLTQHQDISGKQDKATLESDVAAKGFTKNTGTYSKPSGGIPKSDLSNDVIKSLSHFATPQQYGAVGDGVTDDTDAFQEMFDNEHNIYIPDGTYLIDGNYTGKTIIEGGLKPQSDTTILISPNAIIRQTDVEQYYNMFCLYQVENVSIIGGHLIGGGNAHDSATGICIIDSSNITIDGVEIEDIIGDAISTKTNKTSTSETDCDTENITIKNCILHDCRRGGFTAIAGRHIHIDNCYMYNFTAYNFSFGIDIEPNYTIFTADDVRIQNCVIRNTSAYSINVSEKSKGVVIDNCDVESVNCSSANPIIISNSKILSGSLATRQTNITVSNCIITRVLDHHGEATFVNCVFDNLNNDSIIHQESDESVGELSFISCTFEANTSALHLIRGSYDYNVIRFNNCIMNLSPNTSFCLGSRYPKELYIVDSVLNFSKSLYSVFSMSNSASKILHIRGTKIITPNEPSYIIECSLLHLDYDIENTVFPTSAQFIVYNNSSSDGTFRFINNVHHETNTFQIHTSNVVMVYENSHTHTVSQIIDFPTNVSEFTNDSGYLTLATLPIYNGGVQ